MADKEIGEELKKNEKILQRLLMETEMFTLTQLAKKLGYTSVSAISNWKKRGIEWDRILEYFPDIDINYVHTGKRSYAEGSSYVSELERQYTPLQKLNKSASHHELDDNTLDEMLQIAMSRIKALEVELGEVRRLMNVILQIRSDSS